MAYAKIRRADNMVVGVTPLNARQAASKPWSEPDADPFLVEITQVEVDLANEGLIHHGSRIPKFRWAGGRFVNNPDTRPIVTFTPAEINAEIGDVVEVEIAYAAAGTSLREFVFNGVPTRVDFVAGKATVGIDTILPGRFFIHSIEQFQVAAPLQVTVFTRRLGRRP